MFVKTIDLLEMGTLSNQVVLVLRLTTESVGHKHCSLKLHLSTEMTSRNKVSFIDSKTYTFL